MKLILCKAFISGNGTFFKQLFQQYKWSWVMRYSHMQVDITNQSQDISLMLDLYRCWNKKGNNFWWCFTIKSFPENDHCWCKENGYPPVTTLLMTPIDLFSMYLNFLFSHFRSQRNSFKFKALSFVKYVYLCSWNKKKFKGNSSLE